MTKRYRYKSEALASAHEAALALYKHGVISKQRMREYDEDCLVPLEELTPKDIRSLRLRENASETEFARYLCVTPGLVRKWEAGERRPGGPSLKLLTLVAKNGLTAVA